ncbi:MAG TPA: HAMP domain-containing sensor histidine kinase, partial [Acidimicrobiales bacterium]
MTLRRRLVITMVAVVAVGLVAVDVITLASLRSFLVGRVDSQLMAATQQVAGLVVRAEDRGRTVNLAELQSRVSPDVYVEILGPSGTPVVIKPSGSKLSADPAPRLVHPLPTSALSRSTDGDSTSLIYRPEASAITVGSVTRRVPGHRASPGPQYRLLATSLPGRTLVVATRLDSVSATLSSLQAIEVGLTIGLLVLLVLLITVIVRRGLRPLEDMSREADAIAEGDLTRRVHPDDGTTEISRLGRALNGMLSQIETAFAQRAGSEERLRSFLADASHELRTPLTSIQGYAELLRKDALPDQPARDRALSRIGQEAARMGLLV